MLDVEFCRRKQAEYYAKARAATDAKLRSAYEATAREYAHRVRELNLIRPVQKKTARF